MFKKLFSKLKGKKAITGTDVAAAVTVIVLTVGVVTAIYVNAINKSKDNIRYANAVRIATNVIENIQKKTYQSLISTCNESGNSKTVKGGNGKAFDTKIPTGFQLTVTLSNAPTPDVARDVTVNVKYRASKTYKTITLKTTKEKEIIDMVNPPDISLISGYTPNSTTTYYYPLKNTDNKTTPTWEVTTKDDKDWYDYSAGKYGVVGATSTSDLKVGATFNNGGTIYVWIPRFSGSTASDVKYLYGTSNNVISLINSNTTPKVFSYGVNGTTSTSNENFGNYSGLWYNNSDTTKNNSNLPGANVTNAKNAFEKIVTPTNLTFK